MPATVSVTAAYLGLDPLNVSSPPTRWNGSPPAEGTGLDEQQRLIREQAYRDFSTAIQVFLLISSLLGGSHQTDSIQTHVGHLVLDKKPQKMPSNTAESFQI